MRLHGFKVSQNFFRVIEGALVGKSLLGLGAQCKAELLAEVDALLLH
jgi:hypothetical protein